MEDVEGAGRVFSREKSNTGFQAKTMQVQKRERERERERETQNDEFSATATNAV
jgi:hypothetical protein